MGQINTPRPTPDHLGLLRELVQFIQNPRLVIEHVNALEAAQAKHDNALTAAQNSQRDIAGLAEAAAIKSAYADERHDKADERHADLDTRQLAIEAKERQLAIDTRAHDLAVTAFTRAKQETDHAHQAAMTVIGEMRAQAVDMVAQAEAKLRAAEEGKAVVAKLKDDAARLWSAARAAAAGFGLVEPELPKGPATPTSPDLSDVPQQDPSNTLQQG